MSTNMDLAGNDSNNTIAAGDGNDRIRGGGGDDVLQAGGGNDAISGGGGNDRISGGGGDDIIYGGAGNDIINGGKGYDTAVYRGNISDYSFSIDNLGRLHVTDNVSGRDGADLVTNVEEFNFNGHHVLFADLPHS